MKLKCPKCCALSCDIRKDGSFFRKSDSQLIPRYRCKKCGRRFSASTFCRNFNQNKRRVNNMVKKLLCSGVSHRRIAFVLGINRKTVALKRKILFHQAKENQKRRFLNQQVTHIQFDDLETIEHTKLKPVTVTLFVSDERKIIGFDVARIKSKGHLAKLSVRKYGHRLNEAPKMRKMLFEDMVQYIDPKALIETDEHPSYPKLIKKHFPKAIHQTYKSSPSAVAGQGELKKIKHDPLFLINHTFAMLRANISRLVRRTWNTTKDIQALKEHIMIYADFHNEFLT